MGKEDSSKLKKLPYQLWLALAMVLSPMLALSGPVAMQHTFATALKEVQSGSFDGKDYLNIRISGSAGPRMCHGSVLKLYTAHAANNANDISSIALAAMLNDNTVMITVPLSANQCVDGMPIVTDLYLLPATP